MDYLAPIGDELSRKTAARTVAPLTVSVASCLSTTTRRTWRPSGESSAAGPTTVRRNYRRGRSAGRRPSHATRRRKDKPDPHRPAAAWGDTHSGPV